MINRAGVADPSELNSSPCMQILDLQAKDEKIHKESK